jgi:hypothetical protein
VNNVCIYTFIVKLFDQLSALGKGRFQPLLSAFAHSPSKIELPLATASGISTEDNKNILMLTQLFFRRKFLWWYCSCRLIGYHYWRQ